MSTVTAATSPTAPAPAPQPRQDVTGIGLGTLVRVETRKLGDTLAGRWFLVVIAGIVALVVGIMVAVDGGAHGLSSYLLATTTPLGLLLPILGILAATSEWSQRTAMTTFALEPRRGRVIAAKVLAALIAGAASFVVALALAALANAVAVYGRGADSSWELSGTVAGGMAVLLGVGVLQGTAFGLALLNTPAAIVAFLALPTLFTVLGSLVDWVRDLGAWIDVSQTTAPLQMGQSMDAEQWAQLATSTGVWVLLPLAFGAWRVLRAELK